MSGWRRRGRSEERRKPRHPEIGQNDPELVGRFSILSFVDIVKRKSV